MSRPLNATSYLIEMLYRTITTKGIVLVTFTPLQGMSAVVTSFLEPDVEEAKAFKTVIQAGWDDVPHPGKSPTDLLIRTIVKGKACDEVQRMRPAEVATRLIALR